MYAIITAAAFIVILGLLVMIHELGHFLTARFFGVRVEEFGIGFPPRVYPRPEKARQLREQGKTVYSLNALPLGGFVRLAGENGAAPEGRTATGTDARAADVGANVALSGSVVGGDDPGAFANKPAWQRIIVLVAGAFNNMVLAVVLVFMMLAVIGTPHAVAQISGVEVGSPAQAAGLRPGDIITSVNGHKVRDASEVPALVDTHQGQRVTLTVTNHGDTRAVSVVPRLAGAFPCDAGPMGIITTPSYEHYVPVGVGAAARTAINVPGAVVQALGAIPAALFGSAQSSASSSTTSGQDQGQGNCVLSSRYITFGGKQVNALAIQQDVNVPGAIQGDSCLPTTTNGVAVTGPIGIIRQVGCEANAIPTRGWVPLLTLVIELSATLAVINLLPFPALDGGRILFVLIGLVARRRVRPEVEALAHALGMAALLMLIFVISAHDLSNWINSKPTF